MEDNLIVILVLFTVSVIGLSILYLTKSRSSLQKGTRKSLKTIETENLNSIKDAYANSMEIIKEQNAFLMEDAKQSKKKVANQAGIIIRQNGGQQEEEIKITDKNIQEHYEIDVNNGMKLVESMNLPFLNGMDKSKLPELINNPLVKSRVWDFLKVNKDEMISLGVLVPKGSKQTQTEPQQKESTEDGMMHLEFDNKNSNHMA